MIGWHLVYEFYGVDPELLDDEEKVMEILKKVCEETGMKIIKGASHKFTPHGVTGFYILAESHISIHTWPEEGSAAIDVYYCGKEEQVRRAGELLIKYFKPRKVKEKFLVRE